MYFSVIFFFFSTARYFIILTRHLAQIRLVGTEPVVRRRLERPAKQITLNSRNLSNRVLGMAHLSGNDVNVLQGEETVLSFDEMKHMLVGCLDRAASCTEVVEKQDVKAMLERFLVKTACHQGGVT